MEMDSGIYKFVSPTNRVYIGQSKQITKRKQFYYSNAVLNCTSMPKVTRSFKKYGVENHKYSVVEYCDIEKLNDREIYWGLYYDTLENGLNCKLGEQNSIFSNETKSKISKGKKGHACYNEEWREKHRIGILNRTPMIMSQAHKQSILAGKQKPITQYDKDGNIINEFISGAEAARVLNLPQPNINNNCNNKVKSCGGFVFKFKEI